MPTLRLSASEADIDRAAAILRAGGRVAFPTETVYGLGADARDDRAVAGIFAAKDRPRFNPLIVHVPDLASALCHVRWTDEAERLAAAFWPGPMTLVLPLRDGHGLSDLVTSGLPTLAIRMPAHPVAQRLLRAYGGPVAAPSANPSGRISPTTARHVLDGLDGRIEAVIDGGACGVGVESTILSLDGGPVLLRPGGVTAEDIARTLGTAPRERAQTAPLNAPGQMASHYAPNSSVRLNATDWRPGELRLGFGPVDCDLNLSATGDLTEAAANLFVHMHALDAMGGGAIAVSPVPDVGLGRAINDRLNRAAAPRE